MIAKYKKLLKENRAEKKWASDWDIKPDSYKRNAYMVSHGKIKILNQIIKDLKTLIKPTDMTIKFTTEDILEISQSHIDGNSDLFTKKLNEEDAKQLLQELEEVIYQTVSDLVHECVWDDLMDINDQN